VTDAFEVGSLRCNAALRRRGTDQGFVRPCVVRVRTSLHLLDVRQHPGPLSNVAMTMSLGALAGKGDRVVRIPNITETNTHHSCSENLLRV